MLGKLPGGPIDRDNHEQKSDEVLPRASFMSRALNCSYLRQDVWGDSVAFTGQNLVAFQGDCDGRYPIGLTLARCCRTNRVQHNIGSDKWNKREG